MILILYDIYNSMYKIIMAHTYFDLIINNLIMIYLFSRYIFYINHNIITDHSLHKTWRDASREELYQKRQKRISNVTFVKKYYRP